MLEPKSFRGAAPWTPAGALPLDPAVRRSARFAFMDSEFLALTRRTNTKFVPTGLISEYVSHLFIGCIIVDLKEEKKRSPLHVSVKIKCSQNTSQKWFKFKCKITVMNDVYSPKTVPKTCKGGSREVNNHGGINFRKATYFEALEWENNHFALRKFSNVEKKTPKNKTKMLAFFFKC